MSFLYRRAAMDFVNELRVKTELEDHELTIGYVTCVRDHEFGRISLLGLFEDPIEAFRHAARMQEELNQGLTDEQRVEEGWTCDVLPVLPPNR